MHVQAKFRQAECSCGSWVIMWTNKQNNENNAVRRYRADSN